MAGKITEYTNEVTIFGNDDLFDVSAKISSGPDVYESKRVKWSTIKAIIDLKVAKAGDTMTGSLLFSSLQGIDTTATGSTDILYIGKDNADRVQFGRSGGELSFAGKAIDTIFFNSGVGIDTVAGGGTDALNIGATNAEIVNIGRAGATVNILGSVTRYQGVVQEITDPLITLNKGGGAGTAIGTGIEFEENSLITGYIKTNGARNGFLFRAPAKSFYGDFNFNSITADRVYTWPDDSGVVALVSNLSGYVKRDGSLPLTGNWNAGAFYAVFNNVTIGQAPAGIDIQGYNHGIDIDAPVYGVNVVGAGKGFISDVVGLAGDFTSETIAGRFIQSKTLTADNTSAGLEITRDFVLNGFYATAPMLDINDLTQDNTPVAKGVFSRKRKADANGTMEFTEYQPKCITTTNNTAQLAWSFTTVTGGRYWIRAVVIAERTGGAAGVAGDTSTFTVEYDVKNVGGTVTTGSPTAIFTSNTPTYGGVTTVTNGTASELKFTGATNVNIKVSTHVQVFKSAQ